MAITKKTGELTAVCSQEITRYSLTGVLFRAGKQYFCDGKGLAIYTPPKNSTPDKFKADGQVIIDARQIRKLRMHAPAMPRKASDEQEQAINDACKTEFIGNSVKLSVEKNGERFEIIWDRIDGSFPDADAVLPHKLKDVKPVAKICFDADLMCNLLQAIKFKGGAVEMTIYSPKDGATTIDGNFGTPMAFYSCNIETGEEIDALLMPLSSMMKPAGR